VSALVLTADNLRLETQDNPSCVREIAKCLELEAGLIDSPLIIQSRKQSQWPLKKDDFYFKILKAEKEEEKEERTATITSLDEFQLRPFVNEGIERPAKGSTAKFQDYETKSWD
nr:hypothetical protein [Tanacetum cinerariifolium]